SACASVAGKRGPRTCQASVAKSSYHLLEERRRAARTPDATGRGRRQPGKAIQAGARGVVRPAPASVTSIWGWKRPLRSYAQKGLPAAQVRAGFSRKVWKCQGKAKNPGQKKGRESKARVGGLPGFFFAADWFACGLRAWTGRLSQMR